MDVGPLEILLILAVVVMIFGVGKLPEVGSALGKGIREFRNATREDEGTTKTEEAQLQPSSGENVACGVCGAPNTATSRFCSNCGRPMAKASSQPESVDCPTCGAPNTATVRFCTNCGRSITPAP